MTIQLILLELKHKQGSTNPTHFLSTDSNSLKERQTVYIIVFAPELIDDGR